jgi:lipoyl-dependent peroxiredoxin subunit D
MEINTMSLEDLKNALPDYAKDLKLNLSSLERDATLGPRLVHAVMLACAAAARNPRVLRAVDAAAREHLDDATRRAALTAAALMAMNNVYYRFTHLVTEKTYSKVPAQLRMQALANPGVEKKDFELFSLAVSAINGCGMCMDSHEQVLVKAGVSREAVQSAVRIAAVIHAIAAALETEEALSASAA